MTTLLERAIAEIEKLSPDIQDAIAARLLAELADETQWQTQFAATTDEQWQKMVVAVQAEIDEEKTMSLEQFLIEIEKQKQAIHCYQLWRSNPYHPSLQFKCVSPTQPIYSVRISLSYRALGILQGNHVTRFWIGNHSDYEKLLRRI
jgi:hypothetical protein